MSNYNSGKELQSQDIISTSPCSLTNIRCYNDADAAFWVMIFDTTEIPEDGAVPAIRLRAEPRQTTLDPGGTFSIGAVWCISASGARLQRVNHATLIMSAEIDAEGTSSMDAMTKWLDVITDPAKAKAQLAQLGKARSDAKEALATLQQARAEFAKAQADHSESVNALAKGQQELQARAQALEIQFKAHDEAQVALRNDQEALSKRKSEFDAAIKSNAAKLNQQQAEWTDKVKKTEAALAKQAAALDARAVALADREKDLAELSAKLRKKDELYQQLGAPAA